MKLLALCVLAPPAVLAANVRDTGHLRARSHLSSHTNAHVAKALRAGVTPEDIDQCMRIATRFVHGPKDVRHIKEVAADYCTKTNRPWDRAVVCPHYIEAVDIAMEESPNELVMTPEEWCAVAEERMLETRGAARVPNVGSGPLMNFTISESCAPMVEQFMAPKKSVEQSEAGDVWYMACMNQGCAHHLPSRTRSCNMSHPPTHNMWVCDHARRFMNMKTRYGGRPFAGDDICRLYGTFVKELSIDVESYEHVLHEDTNERVPVPGQAHLAVRSAQLENAAGERALKAGAGEPVLPTFARSAAGERTAWVAAAAAVVGLVRL